ncbi:polysaccharide biosynthesis protein [Pseudomonas sp. GD04087]|uniref:polysaccharide biosynthesis protein n=1 Tax=unclassified Pseudomonas TaxID=196821 RepID=UPI0024471729|nr:MULTISPECIES: polysaccharide biosynthesis protein [unclassified Pseudomonas]MDH0288657.1 polysaccharide biosynthesis protein [Pseudomonas sp. GD04087]MDH1049870.1 polysaccharide biosynthesis protein [Pseudomonas sp. GD03903]MDH1998137.1 polysaccharide biosynthesis protein [Pseudomonas sp. GD03691]
MLKDKCLLITGGTGSFGNAVLDSFLHSDLREIRIFSRDEKKQHDMRLRYAHPKLKFYLGDVRDYNSLQGAMRDVNYVFHAAALKQVPSCEFYPMEAVRTNVLGTESMLNAAQTCGVSRVVCLSTDKAVYPVSAMGISKALMEKVVIAKARELDSSRTTVCTTRYGNVMASRGSVIPLLIEQIRKGQPLTLTDPSMTRFMMTLEEAVKLVMFAFNRGSNGDIYVQKAPAASLATLARALCELFDVPNHPIKIIGTRHGEKRSEALLSREEMTQAKDLSDYYCIPPDNRDLNYAKYFEQGEIEINHTDDYSSDNTYQLNLEETKKLLLGLRVIRKALNNDVDELD